MSETTTNLSRCDDEILTFQAGDDELERAALAGPAVTGTPTTPSAIICLPFAPERD